MRILATADLHGAQYRLNILLKNIKKYSPDLVVICGDITQFGPADVAKNFLDQIPVTTFAITGNIDTADVSMAIDESKATNIEMKREEKNGISFVGINGVDPFETQNLLESEKIEELLDENSVLISHVPPHGLQDKVFIGMHAGDKELREIVNKYRPRLVLCGHIHENPGYEKTGKTVVVNCSMGKRGEGALIEINAKLSVKMLD
ncbi:MAG: metallophosphoesterase family protein [Thermoplasmatales archaeon]|nr:metallophosphoesterase family protein [Thermoplasmatales archaeon]